MGSFGYGFWMGLVAGFVLASLLNRDQDWVLELPLPEEGRGTDAGALQA